MNLSNLTPAEGSVKTRKRIGRGTVQDLAALLQKGTKDRNHVRDTRKKSVSKVVRCQFNVVCRNLVLKT
jgi:hypothetical protein